MERKPLYHLAPCSARAAIASEGLTLGNPQNFAHLSPSERPDGVLFLHTDFTMAVRGRGRYTFETALGVVEGDGLVVQADPNGGSPADPGCCTAEPVGVERLRLLV